MKQYTRYLVTSLITPTILITLTLTGMIWLTQALRFLDMIVNRGLNVSTFLYLSSLLLPSLLLLILPVAFFCSVIFVYNKLTHESELVVLEGVGISRFNLAKPTLIVGAGIMCIGYFISLYLMPASFREFKDMQYFIRDNYASVLLQEGVFNSPVRGLTAYISEREDNGLLTGILVHDNRDPKQPATTLMAERGRMVKTASGPRFELRHGNMQKVDSESGKLSLLYFDSYALDLSLYTKNNVDRFRQPKERYLHELFFPVDTKDVSELKIRKLYAEGHQRLTWPLYSIVLPLLAIVCLFSGQYNRRGLWKRMLTASLLSIVLVSFALSLTNLSVNSNLFTALMYVNIIVAIGTCLYILITNPRLDKLLPGKKAKKVKPAKAS